MKIATLILASALAITPAPAQQSPGAKSPAPAYSTKDGAWPRTMRVVIDAGHGGPDKGIVAAGLAEKDTTLQLALALRAELEKRGVQVVLTRASDKLVPLQERVRLSNEVRADCFVSLHKLQRLPGARLRPSPFYALFYFEPRSKALASALSPAIARGLGPEAPRPVVEVSRQRFYVLRQPAPAVMVDVDFQGMSDPSVQAPLVRALADGTVSFLKSHSR